MLANAQQEQQEHLNDCLPRKGSKMINSTQQQILNFDTLIAIEKECIRLTSRHNRSASKPMLLLRRAEKLYSPQNYNPPAESKVYASSAGYL